MNLFLVRFFFAPRATLLLPKVSSWKRAESKSLPYRLIISNIMHSRGEFIIRERERERVSNNKLAPLFVSFAGQHH